MYMRVWVSLHKIHLDIDTQHDNYVRLCRLGHIQVAIYNVGSGHVAFEANSLQRRYNSYSVQCVVLSQLTHHCYILEKSHSEGDHRENTKTDFRRTRPRNRTFNVTRYVITCAACARICNSIYVYYTWMQHHPDI